MPHTHHGHHHGGHRSRFVGVPWNLSPSINPWFQTIIGGNCYWCNSFTGECIPCNTANTDLRQHTGIYEGDLPFFNRQMVGQDTTEAGLILSNKGDVLREKEFLNRYVNSTEIAANKCPNIPAALNANWKAWLLSWAMFYAENPIYINPLQPGHDLDRVKKFENEFASLQRQLAQYCDVSPMINPVDSPSAPTADSGLFGGVNKTVDKGIDLVKWGLIGGVVIIGALALVASQNIKSGGQVASRLL